MGNNRIEHDNLRTGGSGQGGDFRGLSLKLFFITFTTFVFFYDFFFRFYMEANSVLCSANQSSTCIYRLRFFKHGHGKFARCEVMFEVVQKSARAAQAVWPMSLGKQKCRPAKRFISHLFLNSSMPYRAANQ